MEERTLLSISSSVPSFAQGLKILLVHNDTLTLVNLSSMLEKYSFRVIATDEVKAAVSMICDPEESQFNLVMAKDDMPNMDALSFLQFMLEKYIPVIFISSGEYNDTKRKALATGSCYFLEEPILFEDLKYVWQHVYHSQVNLAKTTNKENHVNKVQGTPAGGKYLQEYDKGKRVDMNFDSNHLAAFMEEDEDFIEREQKYDECSEKKPRIVWTPELHQKFVDAINVLSEKNNVRPKAILEQMKVPYLTARQISSHLQKYRTQELLNQQAFISGFTPMATFPNLDGISQFSSGYPGFPISIAAFSGSQYQNQCLYEFPTTGMSNYGCQNLEAEMGQPIIADDVSMDQNQAMRAYDTVKMLEEDCEELDHSQNGLLPHEIDQYCEMLRKTLLTDDSPHP